jgi:hypothetical protein
MGWVIVLALLALFELAAALATTWSIRRRARDAMYMALTSAYFGPVLTLGSPNSPLYGVVLAGWKDGVMSACMVCWWLTIGHMLFTGRAARRRSSC